MASKRNATRRQKIKEEEEYIDQQLKSKHLKMHEFFIL